MGQDDFVGVKIAIRAVSASECLSSCIVSSNRLAEVIQNKERPRAVSKANSNGEQKWETSVGGSNTGRAECCGTRSGGREWVFADICDQIPNIESLEDK